MASRSRASSQATAFASYNNVVANNVAGLAGGGISVTGVPTGGGQRPVVDITQNTVVDNDSTGTAGGRSPSASRRAR